MKKRTPLKAKTLFYFLASVSTLLLFFFGLRCYFLSNQILAYILLCFGFVGLYFIVGKILLLLSAFNKTGKVVVRSIIKYFALILPLIGLFSKDVEIDEKYTTEIFTVLTSFLPMVFTILVVTLSRQNDEVYGLDSHHFRKLRRDIHFGLLEMIMIGIILFVEGFLYITFSCIIALWVLDFVSVCYSVLFLTQEILIITKNKKYLHYLVKDILRYNIDYKKTSHGDEEELQNVDSIVRYIINKKGIKGLYDEIKD